MKTFTCLTLFPLWGLIFLGSITLAQDGAPISELQLQAQSLIEACISTLDVVQSGDCLVKEVRSYNTLDVVKPNEIAQKFERTVFHRLIFEHTTKRYLYVKNGIDRTSFIPPDSNMDVKAPSTIIGEVTHGLAIDEKGLFLRTLPHKKASLNQNKSIDRFLYKQNVIDHRMAGFGILTLSELFDNKEAFTASKIALATKVARIRNLSSGNMRLEFVFDMPGSGSPATQTTRYEIDPKRFVIVEVAADATDNSGPLPKTGIIGRRHVDWTDVENLSVPVRVLSRSPTAVKISERTAVVLDELVYTFHWFSVNKELGPESFDSSLLDNETTMLRFADPKATKATTLLETEDTISDK